MKMNIKVNLTYEQTKALVSLGMTQFEQNITEYNIVENRVRSSIDFIYGFIDYINSDNEDESYIEFLNGIIAECDKLFENKLVNTYYWSDNFDQKERIISIKQKAEFLLSNSEEHSKRELNYPKKMNDHCRDFIINLNK